MSLAPLTVWVEDIEELEVAVSSHVANGFMPKTRTGNATLLTKPNNGSIVVYLTFVLLGLSIQGLGDNLSAPVIDVELADLGTLIVGNVVLIGAFFYWAISRNESEIIVIEIDAARFELDHDEPGAQAAVADRLETQPPTAGFASLRSPMVDGADDG